MLTRCPSCETHFRVTAEQLKVRAGRVRCGACQHVFNSLDSLIEEPTVLMAAAPASGLPPEDLAPIPADRDIRLAAQAAGAEECTVAPAPTFRPESESQPEQEPQPASKPAPEPLPDSLPESNLELGPLPADVFSAPEPAPRRWPWVIGCLIALALVTLQAALAFRVELTVLWPQTRPALTALCQFAGCEIGLPAKVNLIGIEASDLHPDSDYPGRLALAATLKNRAPFAQQFPHLELTLTDTADQAIARKVLAPADYLPPATAIADGMPPNADIMLTVGVEPRDLPASGYRLYLFYP